MEGKRSILCGAFAGFFPPFSPPLSTVYQCDGCLSSRGMRLMAGLSGFASHWVSLHFGAGSSRMSQAPNLHLTMQLSIIIVVLISETVEALDVQVNFNEIC